eukprot:7712469-Alexandrium_andersonii.AAC.1
MPKTGPACGTASTKCFAAEHRECEDAKSSCETANCFTAEGEASDTAGGARETNARTPLGARHLSHLSVCRAGKFRKQFPA